MQDLLAVPTPKSGHLLQTGQSLLELQFDIANNFSSDDRAEESIRLDGERTTLTFRWQQGINDQWQVGAELPVINDSGGDLDSVIQKWHELWGLPGAGRGSSDSNQLHYYYTNLSDGSPSVNFRSSAGGVGDLRLLLARSLVRNPGRALSVHGQLKLPTGETSYLRSSGSTDMALGLSFADDKSLGHLMSYYVNSGGIWLGNADLMDDKRQQFMAYGNIGIAWQAISALCLKLQLDAHSSGYNSQLSELNESVQLVVGGSVRISKNWLLDIAFNEDLLVDTAPDISFLLNLVYLHSAN